MNLWLPGVDRIPGPHANGNPMTGGPRRACTWHRTVGGTYASNRSYLVQKGFEPTVLWDPWTGQLGQFLPADRGAYALRHIGDPPTNTLGTVHVQIEVVDRGSLIHLTDTPLKGWPTLRAWLTQLGIPETLPAGPMLPLGQHRSATTAVWSKSGHFGHCHAPENDHTDPGLMDFTRLFTHAPAPPKLSIRQNRGYATLVWTAAEGAAYYEPFMDGKPLTTTKVTSGKYAYRRKLSGAHVFRVLAVAPDGAHTWSNQVPVAIKQ
jgi:hypothetical protein